MRADSVPRWGACLVLALVTILPLQASVVIDNFDDNALNTGLWSPIAFGAGSVSEVNQRLEVTVAGDGAAGARLRGLAIGNFDLRFDYILLSDGFDLLNPDDEPAVGVLWFFPDPGETFLARGIGCIEAQLNDTDAGEACYLETVERSGRLRLTRKGDVYTAYHRNGSGWDLLVSGASPLTGPADIWLFAAESDRPGFSAALDNFRLQADGFAGEVPEPGTVALAGLGLGLAWGWARRRRGSGKSTAILE